MSRQAGANVDNDVGVLGGRFTWGPTSIGLVEYFCQDTLNIAYGEAEYGVALSDKIFADLAVQYADQRTVGASLTNGGTPTRPTSSVLGSNSATAPSASEAPATPYFYGYSVA
jgi:hypothetical protein